MLVVHQTRTDPHPCAYRPDQVSVLRYDYVARLSGAEYEALMDRGCRKFGPAVFRPVCPDCNGCRPIRVPVESFRPDRSQRRAWKRNQDLEVRLARPTVDAARLHLYHRYHVAQQRRKGWPETERSEDEYAFAFVRNPVPAVEITLWEGDALRAVVLTDVTPNVVSGVYHYYDPTDAARGLGTACMLHTIELARRLEKRWAYFGYYVAGCPSLAYKARFRPCEVMDLDGTWRPFDWTSPG
jgi:leucyl-tRNA---protein transferase